MAAKSSVQKKQEGTLTLLALSSVLYNIHNINNIIIIIITIIIILCVYQSITLILNNGDSAAQITLILYRIMVIAAVFNAAFFTCYDCDPNLK